MKNYYKMMLGPKSKDAEFCLKEGLIGADYNLKTDLTLSSDDRRDFNKKYAPLYLKDNPNNSKLYAPIVCNALWVLSKGIKNGDIVVCPNGKREFVFGEIVGDYKYHPNAVLPHQRSVKWLSVVKKRAEVSKELNDTTKSQGNALLITRHAEEIESLIAGDVLNNAATKDVTIEDVTQFALEKHLEEFLVQNWKQTELGKQYDIYEEDGELVGQQYQSDTGPLDILAISKDKKELLVVELKRGRVSDSVVGQIQRYMGYVQEELAEENQIVKGVIIALEDDIRIRRALSVAKNIEFYRYQVSFKLFKGM
jgi:restriction system protein